ncbi:hypothetical protein, partial [Actinomyces sp. oral taxon 181]|uniref:hypothetical protein n=1 Tax=Actinomyces sp. oral taxon 181 TaxID=712121 RepID=UPI0002A4396C
QQHTTTPKEDHHPMSYMRKTHLHYFVYPQTHAKALNPPEPTTIPNSSANYEQNEEAETPDFHEENSHSSKLNNAPSHANYSTEKQEHLADYAHTYKTNRFRREDQQLQVGQAAQED